MTDCERLFSIIIKVVELRRGTFLALEAIQEYENSGKWIKMQGKYLPVIRRGILLNDGFLSEGNDYFQGLWKTVTIVEDYD